MKTPVISLRRLKHAATFLVLAYVGILVFLLANETALVYPGSKYPRGNWSPQNFDFEEVEFQSSDGTNLVGWFLSRPDSEDDEQVGSPSETILLCHGNAENVAQSSAYMGDMLRKTLNADVFVFDYRGYGKSEGIPDEHGLTMDSESALAWLERKSGKKPGEIIVVGHSIGGGPAVHLASTLGAKILVLQRTFNALTEPAANQYPWLPVRYLMRNQFRSIDKIKDYQGPVFQSHGALDRLIPISMGRELFDAAPTESKLFYSVENMSHYDPLPDQYWTELARFVREFSDD